MVKSDYVNIFTSIITPAFIDTPQKINWLDEMVQSVIEQSRTEWEIIIVDDGSPLPIINHWNDERISVYRISNQGTSIARNTAAEIAKHPLLLPLDSDDKLYSHSLELLYNNWEPTKFVYGNVDLLIPKTKEEWNVGSSIRFPEFNCSLILNPKAPAPVTAIHLKESWKKAGGWKSELDNGLEDVEYWISMVRSSCTLGKRIDQATLLYRKHENSRTQKMKNNNFENDMREKIRHMHADVYGGKDMGCGCGGSRPSRPVGRALTREEQLMATSELMATALSNGDLFDIQYVGARSGNFGVVGNVTRQSYRIGGTGAIFQVHRDDVQRFLIMGRNRDRADFILIGKHEIKREAQEPKIDNDYVAPPVEISEEIKESPTQSNSNEAANQTSEMLNSFSRKLPTNDLSMDSLPIRQFVINNIIKDGWDIERLANAKPESLLHIKGVGKKSEQLVLKYAREVFYGSTPIENVV